MELCILYENSTKVLKAFQNTDKLTAIKRGEKKAISCYKCGKKGHTTKIYKATIEPCTTCGSNSHLTSLNNPNYHKKTFFPKKSKIQDSKQEVKKMITALENKIKDLDLSTSFDEGDRTEQF